MEPMNIPWWTRGGGQLWTDYFWREGYRIQHSALTGHWRLLDHRNIRRAWGSKDHCHARLEAFCPAQSEEALKPVVFLLHGLMRTRGCMKKLAREFEQAGYQVIRFSYASTRADIATHARALRETLEAFPDATKFSFVGHSMGNIVVRRMLGALQEDDSQELLERLRSLVMLGPPNQGAAIARLMAKTGLFGLVTGKGAMELGPKWEQLSENLATPPFPFAIIAGDRSKSWLQNPLIQGPDDFVVTVEETRLEGAAAFETLPVLHAHLMKDKRAIESTLAFVSQQHPRPIVAAASHVLAAT